MIVWVNIATYVTQGIQISLVHEYEKKCEEKSSGFLAGSQPQDISWLKFSEKKMELRVIGYSGEMKKMEI